MDNTIQLLKKQHHALVEVIQWLDSNKHSNKPIRELVDQVLNHEKKLVEGSEMELTKISLKKPQLQHIYQNQKAIDD
jgi:hypothetical protein